MTVALVEFRYFDSSVQANEKLPNVFQHGEKWGHKAIRNCIRFVFLTVLGNFSEEYHHG